MYNFIREMIVVNGDEDQPPETTDDENGPSCKDDHGDDSVDTKDRELGPAPNGSQCFHPGQRVIVHGVKARSELNGQIVRLQRHCEEARRCVCAGSGIQVGAYICLHKAVRVRSPCDIM